MTSHYRHRRISDPATAFPTLIEPGEIAVNTANRQLAVGDANPGSAGAITPLLAVRYFDARAQYVANEFAVQAGNLFRSKSAISPGAFNPQQWDAVGFDASLRAYSDDGDAAVTTAYKAADAAIITNYQAADTAINNSLGGKVDKAGSTMTGALILAGSPTAGLQAATKAYVDTVVSTGGISPTAAQIVNVPAGNISSVDVQAALNELDGEKAPLASPVFTGNPTAPTPAVNDNDASVATTAFVVGQASTLAPLAAGTAAPGTSLKYAREDHIHPSDNTRAPIASPVFTGNPQAPTPTAGDNDTSIATTAFVQAAVGVASAGFSTADAKLTLKTVADPGWVMMNDGTIGDASSGGTARANPDTQALFIVLYTNIPDSLCPVSGGRTNAGADYAAHKTIKLPLSLGRALAVAGSGAGLSARALGQFAGEEAHTLTANEQASMGVNVNVNVSGATSPVVTDVTPNQGNGYTEFQAAVVGSLNVTKGAVGISASGSGSGTASGGGAGHNNVQPTSFWNVMVKL